MKTPQLNVVLVEPVIPQNTGNIGRLTAATTCRLHLIEPLGFDISDKKIRRAGLDYWPEVDMRSYRDWQTFLDETRASEERMWFFTTKGTKVYYDIPFERGDYLVFGSETTGLAPEFHQRYHSQRYKLPIDNANVRSLNLANAVAAVVYEARRQIQSD